MTYTRQPRPDAPLPQVAHRPRLQAAMARLYAQITQPGIAVAVARKVGF